MNNYIKTRINAIARSNNLELIKRHYEILEYAYNYYEKNKVGPLFYSLSTKLHATKKEIKKLFPHGLNSIYTWIGIPIQRAEHPCKTPVVLKINKEDYREVYLDHNATTYVRPEVSKILKKHADGIIGYANPSSSTLQGKQAYDYINSARKKIASCLKVSPEEIIFTGSGSESNNTAIKGIAFKNFKKKGHIVTNNIEHPATLRTIEYLSTLGFPTTIIEVGKDGLVSPQAIQKAISKDTVLVAVMYVNNEIGTINPIKEIGDICKKNKIALFVDAVQAFGKIKINPKALGISLMSFSGHKIYAPKGVGGLYISKEIKIPPLIHGGGQEGNLRSGTENVSHIIAMGKAAELSHHEMEKENNRILELRNYFLEKLKKIEPQIIINDSIKSRIPHNLSIAFPGIDSGALLLSLNTIGICVSVGSACSSGKIKSSHVIEALGKNPSEYGTIRFSFGLKTKKQDLDYLFKYLPVILQKLKEKN